MKEEFHFVVFPMRFFTSFHFVHNDIYQQKKPYQDDTAFG